MILHLNQGTIHYECNAAQSKTQQADAGLPISIHILWGNEKITPDFTCKHRGL